MRTGSGIQDCRDAWAIKDALAIARGPWGGPASSRRDRPGATASGLRHMGIAGGRRRAGAPRGIAGDLGSMAIVPHRTRRGPSAVTGTEVTVSGPWGRGGGLLLCPRGHARSLELDRDLWILCRGPSARERPSGLSLSLIFPTH